MTTALQDAQLDCDWMPYEVFERHGRIAGKDLQLYGERYQVLVVPPVEVIPYAALAKVQAFFEGGGIVLGYGFLPSKSATLGHGAGDIAALCEAIWGPNAGPGMNCCRTSAAGGRSYLLKEKPTSAELQRVLADARIRPGLEVLAGETGGWLHVLHRVKAGQDVFLVCNQNHQGAARQFRFRATAAGVPECWDAVRNEITAIPFRRTGESQVEFSLAMQPLESVLIVFRPQKIGRPPRIEAGMKPVRESIRLARDANPPAPKLPPWMRTVRRRSVPWPRPILSVDILRFRPIWTWPCAASAWRWTNCRRTPRPSASTARFSGGVIGQPARLDMTRHLKAGENSVVIEPLAPQSARLVFYGAAEGDRSVFSDNVVRRDAFCSRKTEQSPAGP